MHYNRRHVFAAACLGMLLFGIVSTTLGTILPSVLERFAVGKAQAGSVFVLLSFGILLGSFVFGPVADHYGFKGLLIACAACILVGIEAVAFAPTFNLLCGAVLMVGFGGGVINGGTNALVADIFPDDRSVGLSYLGVFFGIGAFGIPFVLGFLLDYFSYSMLIAAVGVPVAAVLAYFLFVTFPDPKQPHGLPLAHALQMLRDPSLLILGALLFLQSGIEMTTGGWASSFFHEELGFRAGPSVFFLSLFWLALTLARVAMGRLLRRYRPARLMRAFVLIALAGALMMVLSDSVWLAGPGIFLTGFGLAAGFPVALGFAGDLYPSLSGTAFGLLFVISLIGGSTLPFVTGVLSEDVGLRGAFILIPIALVLQIGMLQVARRRMDDHSASDEG